jgi:TPR repeat protein
VLNAHNLAHASFLSEAFSPPSTLGGKMSRRRDEGRLQRAAEAGDMEAATSLADMLEDDGDLSGAEHWNRVAATAGDMHGALGLGLILAGKGNLEQAAEWLRTAATSKNPPSEKMAALAAGALGRALLQLNDIDEAEAWIEKGAAAGFEEAQEDLEKLQRIRSGHTEHGASSGSSSETLQARIRRICSSRGWRERYADPKGNLSSRTQGSPTSRKACGCLPLPR